MKLIKAFKQKLAAWRQHREDQQFLTGYRWARMAYYEEGRTLGFIEREISPLGRRPKSSFDHGVHHAIRELRKLEIMSDRLDRLYQALNTEHDEVTETNANGDPVGVPYFIGTCEDKDRCRSEVTRRMEGFRIP